MLDERLRSSQLISRPSILAEVSRSKIVILPANMAVSDTRLLLYYSTDSKTSTRIGMLSHVQHFINMLVGLSGDPGAPVRVY
jgi:hypothetical protein